MSTVEVSIVIAAHNAVAVIATCLSALEPQCTTATVEVIVADSSIDETPDIVARRFPWVRLLHFDQPLAVPALRGRAIAASRGQIVAILDSFSVVATDWVEQVRAAHARRPNIAIGGPVDLYRAESRSWTMWTT